MRYTQKDICRAFDIKRDTLRHYERLGIIEPEVDSSNGYRYYDDWQINLLWDAKRYQSMGFSLAEVHDILHGDSLSDVQARVSGRLDRLREEQVYLERRISLISSYSTRLNSIEERLDRYVTEEMPALRFVPRCEVHELMLSDSLAASGAFANANLALSIPCAHFPSMDGELYYWGFAMLEEWYDHMGGPEEGSVSIPAGSALLTCVDAGERWGFGRRLFDGLVAEAERLGRKPLGMLCGYLLTRTYDEDGRYHRYVEAVLPLEE